MISGVLLLVFAGYLHVVWCKERKGGKEPQTDAKETQPDERKLIDIETVAVTADVAQSTIQHDVVHGDITDSSVDPLLAQTGIGVGVNSDFKPDVTEKAAQQKNTVSTVTDQKKGFGPRRLVCVAILGSLDDWVVQSSMLLSNVFSPFQLLIGVFLGACAVVVVCVSANLCTPVVHCIERVPLWVIIYVLAVFTVVATFVGI